MGTATKTLKEEFTHCQDPLNTELARLTTSNFDFSTQISGQNLNNFFTSSNGHSLSFDHVRNPGLGTSNTIKGTGQIYNDGNNKVTGTVFGTRHRYPRQANGHDVFGGSIDYSNQRGDAGKITYSNTPIIDRQQVGVQGKYNIHKTPDSAVSVYGGATKDIGRYQPRNSRPDYNVGIEYSRKF